MSIAWNEHSEKAFGGTETVARRLENELPKELLENFQIFPSRVRDRLDESKIRIYWAHDLARDPESDVLKNGGWDKFHRIVFVSYWQRDAFIREYNIPHSKCVVIQNSITPIEPANESLDKVRLIYHTTPHRGLELLVPVFEKLCETHDDIHLDVFSSFNAYGWGDRDEPYKKLFDKIKDHDKMTYHGFQPNDVVRDYLSKAHIYAYPSIWMETSCISLMEAMSAECICVHPDYGALPETAANWTMMYSYHEDLSRHAGIFYNILNIAIDVVKEQNENQAIKLKGQKSYVDLYYNWEIKKAQWEAFLTSLLNEPREFPKPKEIFEYKIA